MPTQHRALKTLLWVICGYHILAGLLFNAPASAVAWVAQRLGGMTQAPDAGAIFLARPFGIYLLAFGVAMGAAAWNPVKNRALITIGSALFLLRVVQRIFTLDHTTALFGMPFARNVAMLLLVTAFAVALAWFRWRLYAEMRSGPPTPPV